MKKMWKRLLAAGLSVSLALSLAACGHGSTAQDMMGDIKPQKISRTEPLHEPGAEALTDFSVRLMQSTAKAGESTLLSPLSVLTALSMTANGADGETRAQMEKVLGMKVEELNSYLYSYLTRLNEGGALKPANSIWFADDERFTVNQDFLQLNADYYGADIYKAPFDQNTCRDINNWVKDKTEGMIPEILDEIPRDAIMYLINALAFEGEWIETYEESSVREHDFILADGTKKTVEFLHGVERKYLECDLGTGFIKPYKGDKYAFAALLPKEGKTVEELVAALDGKTLHDLLTHPSQEEVITSIPKFKTDYSTELRKILSNMGMPLAFDEENADFSKLGSSAEGNIYLSRVLHKTFLELGEKGTRAGAVTVVEAKCEGSACPIDPPKQVILNRPFLYMLVDMESGVPFFVGTMQDPAA